MLLLADDDDEYSEHLSGGDRREVEKSDTESESESPIKKNGAILL